MSELAVAVKAEIYTSNNFDNHEENKNTMFLILILYKPAHTWKISIQFNTNGIKFMAKAWAYLN